MQQKHLQLSKLALLFPLHTLETKTQDENGTLKVIRQVSDRTNIHTQVWVQSLWRCTALSPSAHSFSPSLFPPLQKLTCHVCCVACVFSHFLSSVQKGLDVVSTSSTTNTSYTSSCELPRTRPGYFLSDLVLEQSVLGSCHLSYPSPWLPSNCSSEAFSHPGAGSLKSIPLPLPRFLTKLHQLASGALFNTQLSKPLGQGACSTSHPF